MRQPSAPAPATLLVTASTLLLLACGLTVAALPHATATAPGGLSGRLGCKLTGPYHDASCKSCEYSLNQTSATAVGVACEAGQCGWAPSTGLLYGADLARIAVRFSNAGGRWINGTVSPDCSVIEWDNGAVWEKGAPPPVPDVTSIHVVTMTHLDLGFTDTTRNVCDTYFDKFFPAAFATAAELRKRGGPESFRWTEFPWLIQEYLDHGANCAHRNRTAAEISAIEAAIAADDVIWHGTAVNFLPEVLDEDMWAYSLGMAKRLNARFGKRWGALVGKHTDTPGMSRSAIPALAAVGIKAYHIGYNPSCAKNVGTLPPAFRWQEPSTGAEILTMVNNNYGSEIDVADRGDEADPPEGRAVVLRHGIAGADDIALVFHFMPDNTGPPTADQVVSFWASLRKRYPNATIQATSLDDFYTAVAAKADLDALPLIRQEVGDSWLYGVPADPVKVSTFREARRALREAVAAGAVDARSSEYDAYMRRLMKGPCEHNWGLSINHGAWAKGWDNPTFHSDDAAGAGKNPDYAKHETEWAAQREWMHACTDATARSGTLPLTCPWQAPDLGCANITGGWLDGGSGTRNEVTQRSDGAVAIVADSPSSWATASGTVRGKTLTITFGSSPAPLTGVLDERCGSIAWSNQVTWSRAPNENRTASPQWAAFVATLEARLAKLANPTKAFSADTSGLGPPLTPSQVGATVLRCVGGVTVGFDGAYGSINLLNTTTGGRRDHVAWVTPGTGQALARFGYQTFSADNYTTFAGEYTQSGDFQKQGMDAAAPVGKHWPVALRRGWARRDPATGKCVAVMEVGVADPAAHAAYGAPATVTLAYAAPGADGADVDVTVVTANKTSTRLAEAQWLSFVPSAGGPDAAWAMDVLNHSVDPRDVVAGGTHWVHSVQDGVGVTTEAGTLTVRTLDAPLLSPGDTDHLLRYNDDQPSTSGGMHFSLHNNLWGTAFPQWYGGDGVARFQIYTGS